MSAGRKPEKWLVRDAHQAVSDRRVDPVVMCTALEGVTRQADKDSCDINRIVKSYFSAGIPLPGIPEQVFADVSQGWDYRESLERAKEAEGYFRDLPAVMRERYGNDPFIFFDRVMLDENIADAVELGLREKPVEVPDVPADPPPA